MASPIENIKKETLVAIFIAYLRATSPIMLFVHLFYVAALLAMLSTSYVIAFHWTSLVRIYDEAHSIQSFSINLKQSVETDNRINMELTDAMTATSGIRAYVYRYHNGLAAISGVPFFFQTNTNEVISPGTSRLMPYEQRIPVAIHMGINSNFVDNHCAVIRNTDTDRQNQNYYFWTSRAAKSLIRCPIYMDDGDLFGFVGVDFNRDIVSEKRNEDIIHELARRIAGLFQNNRR